MTSKIKTVKDGKKPRMVASVEVSKRILIPESIVGGRSVDLLVAFIEALGGLVLRRTKQDCGSWIYELSVRRSTEIPNGAKLRTVLNKMLAVYEKCLEDNLRKDDERSCSFFDIDQRRPNVTSRVMVYCLHHSNIFTRCLVGAIKVWLLDELKIKQDALRQSHDDEILVGPPRLSRSESRDLEDTLTTRRLYLQLIGMFEDGEFEKAIKLAKDYNFVDG